MRSDAICRNGFVNLYHEGGQFMLEYGTSPSGVSVRGLRWAEGLTDCDIVDCVFARRDGGPVRPRLHDPEKRRGYREAFAWTRSELDGFPAIEHGHWIDMRRRYRAYVGLGGDVLRDSIEGRGELRLATYGPYPSQTGDA